MNKFFKTASIISAGILVSVVARKMYNPSVVSGKPASPDYSKNVKSIYDKNALSEDVNNYFV